jgi:hypothetical protein
VWSFPWMHDVKAMGTPRYDRDIVDTRHTHFFHPNVNGSISLNHNLLAARPIARVQLINRVSWGPPERRSMSATFMAGRAGVLRRTHSEPKGHS